MARQRRSETPKNPITGPEEAERAIDLSLRGWVSSVAGQGDPDHFDEWLHAAHTGDYVTAARLSGGPARDYEDVPVRITPLLEQGQPNGCAIWSKVAVVGPFGDVVEVGRASVNNDDPDYDGPPTFWEMCLTVEEWRQLGEWARS